MALATRTLRGIKSINRCGFFATAQKNHVLSGPCLLKVSFRSVSDNVGSKSQGTVPAGSGKRDPAPFFFNDEVQSCLLEMNMRETSKVFQPRKEGQSISDVEIKYLTDEELEEEQQKAVETARYYLQLPPILAPKEDSVEILSKDPALQGSEEFKLLVTDISYGVPHRERLIVARDPDGTLRHASKEERYRMMQTYFPDSARSYEPPQLFSAPNLNSLFERSEFVYILDRACVQFEPDDPDYISVTSSTFDFIENNSKFDELLGTRHYGAMAFYLVFNGRLDKFLNHCISTYRIHDAVSLVQVFYLTRPNIKEPSKPSSPDDSEFIKDYIKTHAIDKATLSKSLNAYLELNLPTAAEEAALAQK